MASAIINSPSWTSAFFIYKLISGEIASNVPESSDFVRPYITLKSGSKYLSNGERKTPREFPPPLIYNINQLIIFSFTPYFVLTFYAAL